MPTHRLLIDLPAELTTPRLLLRPPRPGEGAAVFEAVAESIDRLRPWVASMPWVAEEPSPEASEMYCRRAAASLQARDDFAFLIWQRSDGRLLGSCGLHRADWSVPRIEVGYWLRSSATGQGVATEATQALLPLAFGPLGMERVEILCEEGNAASRAVAERCGFTLEGVLRHNRRAPGGELRSTCVYALLRPSGGG